MHNSKDAEISHFSDYWIFTRSKNTLQVQNGSTNMGSLAGYWIILRLFSLTFQVFFHIEKQNN